MKKDGAEAIQAAVSRYKNVVLGAIPREGEDIRYFPIFEDPTWSVQEPSRVLNALDEAGLMLHGESAPVFPCDEPQLRYLGSVGATLTFEDLSAK